MKPKLSTRHFLALIGCIWLMATFQDDPRPWLQIVPYVVGLVGVIALILGDRRRRRLRGDSDPLGLGSLLFDGGVAFAAFAFAPSSLVRVGTAWRLGAAAVFLALLAGRTVVRGLRDRRRELREFLLDQRGWSRIDRSLVARRARNGLRVEALLPPPRLLRRAGDVQMADDQIEIRVAGMQATVSIRVAAAGSPRDAGRLDPQLRGVEVAGDEAIMACLIALEGPLIAELFRSYGAWSNDRVAIRVKLPAAGDERAVRSNAAWLLSAARKLRRAATPPTATTLLAAMNRANTAELRASCFALLIERFPESTEAAEARRLEKNASPGQLALPEATAIAGAVSVASTPGAVSIAKKVTT